MHTVLAEEPDARDVAEAGREPHPDRVHGAPVLQQEPQAVRAPVAGRDVHLLAVPRHAVPEQRPRGLQVSAADGERVGVPRARRPAPVPEHEVHATGVPVLQSLRQRALVHPEAVLADHAQTVDVAVADGRAACRLQPPVGDRQLQQSTAFGHVNASGRNGVVPPTLFRVARHVRVLGQAEHGVAAGGRLATISAKRARNDDTLYLTPRHDWTPSWLKGQILC